MVRIEKYFSVNQNGFSIRCKLYCTDIRHINSVVLFCHGFSGNKDNRMAETVAKRIQKRHNDIALLIFDWPCHGDDASNELRLADCSAYLNNVIEYVKTKFHTDKIYVSATSFGGYLTLKYIAENGNPFIRVAFRCPAVNMYDTLTCNILTEEDLSTIRKGKPISVGFDRKVKINNDFLNELKDNDITILDYRSYSNQLMIVHGTKDEIVSYDVVRGFAEKNGIALYTVEGADHRFTNPNKMDEAITSILSHLFQMN